VGDSAPPFCSPNPVGTPVRQELFETVLYSYASVPLADTFSGPSLLSLNGMPVESGTPTEIEAAIWNIQKIDQARRSVGRPGMGCHNFISCAEKTDAIIASARPGFGAKPGDGLLNGAIAELKVDYERLKKVAFMRNSGLVIGGLYGPIMGGYAGGPESTAIVHVAHHFLGLLAFEVQWHDGFPLHLMQGCNSTRDLIWLISVTGQALTRNTHLLIGVSPFTAAGPCTEMVIDEIVAVVTAATVSGLHLNLLATARNKYPEYSSGMEARIGAEAGHLVARQGVTREQANSMVKKILARYEDKIADAPRGKRFDECYDLDTVQPTREYLDLYDRGKEFLGGLGLEY
ncbi:hypothetical protein LCGC14_2862270, partial [marine sediment metagenome]